MSKVHCQLLETVVVRDLGVAVQVLELDGSGVRLSVQTASPRRVGQQAISDQAARRTVRDQLKQQAHAAAETLNQLHQELERHGAIALEPVVCRIYRQLRELDTHIDSFLHEGSAGRSASSPALTADLPTLASRTGQRPVSPTLNTRASSQPLSLPFPSSGSEPVSELDWDI